MTTKHTPGPWRTNDHNTLQIIDHHPYTIATVAATADREAVANARLLAAAPELLAACVAAAELLIADENGQTVLSDPNDIEAETELLSVRGMIRAAIAQAVPHA